MRLRHQHTGVQITVHEDKGHRLITEGLYRAVPDAEQTPPIQPVRYDTDGPTSIAGALNDYDRAPNVVRVRRASR